ncbi:targeting protein for Xklp2 [Lampris incognitus]|uniref:targeting protein for Xklp2 n=1 Tax=Lampris incognitus TaxID=2546036 RepID=UPI0024B5126B|nr:targeting protein for Xklp2 [Lampris incognitus]
MALNDSNGDSNCYEFDAPSHVMDFQEPDNADDADLWFEKQMDGGHLVTPQVVPLESCRTAGSPHATHDQNGDSTKSSSPPSNIVTSWGTEAAAERAVRPKRKPAAPAQARRVSKRKEKACPAEVINAANAPPPVKKQRPLGSEEQELERIRNLQREVAEHRRKNEASYKAALAGGQPSKKLAVSTTVPKEFNFCTDTRAKVGCVSSTAAKEVDFISQLRNHPSSPTRGPKCATVPKPFNLSAGCKRNMKEAAAYMSMAEQIEQFQRRTPDRYHLRSRQSQEKGPSPVKGELLRITRPHTPQLLTRQRTRPTKIKSSAELEAEEMEELHKFKFKAQKLNRKILENTLNPKKPLAKEPTKPESFELQIEKRLQERQMSKKHQEAEEQQHCFHSRPVPTKILQEVVGVPEKKVQNPTMPESPAFALKKRVRMDRKVEEVKEPSPIKANPVPHFGLPFQPRLADKSHFEVCPFSFEERDREKRALKEKRLEEMRNEEVPRFKAQPLPDFQEVALPEKKVVEPTKPEPFKLLIDQRGAVRNDRWEQMVKDEQKRQAEAFLFKARPNTITHKEPFLPKKENRGVLEGINHSTVAEAFELSTERRARERLEYDRAVCEKEALKARMEEEQRQEREEREKGEILKLRQEQVHKAMPIRRYKPVELKRGDDIALTVPRSPNFSDRFRM